MTISKLDSFFTSFFFRLTIAKTNAQKQREYREREKKLRNENSYASSTDTVSNDADTDGTISPMIVSIPFPKRGEASRKRKRWSDDRFYKKIAKLENEKKTKKTEAEM